MAKKSRRFLALVLTLVLAFSLLPIGGMAGQEDTALPTVSIAHNGEERTQTGANGESITTQKTISSVSGSNNQFDITLNVRTVSNSQTTITSGKAAHVVVVIDTSASMKDEGRMSSAKAAASSFIKDMLTNTNSSNKIAVVKYDNSATTLAQLSSDKETLTNVVNQINYNSNGGTNIQGGLKMARDILAADTDTGVSKIILLLSDGEPTYSYRLSGTATIGCSSWTDWFGESHHNFNGNLSNINVTGCNYTTLVGCGGSYYATDAAYTDGRLGNAQNNLYITATCTHGYVVSGNVRYNGGSSIINQGYANNGYATIWEAGQSKEAGTEIYSVMLKGNATSKSVMKSIATNSAHYQETDNVSALTQLFKNISSTVNNSAGGSTVTDPMSQYVALNAESIQTNTAASGAIVLGEPKTGEASVNEASTTISWDLSKATGNASTITNGSSSTTTTVYQLKYRVTVARNAAFYDAVKASTYTDKGVATNGTTFVNYTIGGTDGVLNFDVPRVTSVMPTVGCTVNYYKLSKTSNAAYELVSGDSVHESGNYGDTYTVTGNYQTKYSEDNYQFNNANPTNATITLGLDPDSNVINLYYDPITTSVKVNHYYTTYEYQIGEGGSKILVKTQNKELINPQTESGLYVGNNYTATELTHIDNRGDYTALNSNVKTITLEQSAESNVINLYYERTLDERAAATYDVDHIYTTRTYVINADGTYTGAYTDTEAPHAAGQGITGKAGDTVTACEAAVSGYVNQGSSTQTLTLKAGNDNHIVFNYLKTVELGDAKATVHYTYTTTTKYYEDGVLKTKTAVSTWESAPDKTLTGKVGQTISIPPANREGFTWDSSNQNNVVLTGNEQNVTVNYNRTVEPTTTSITVTHHYKNFVWDDASSKWVEKDSHKDVVVNATGYVGDHYTVEKAPNGYTYVSGDYPAATNGVVSLEAQSNVFNLYYELYNDPNADLTVTHHYTLTIKYIDENGNDTTKTETYETSEANDHFTGTKGTEWNAVIKEAHGCTLVSGQTTSGILRGSNGQVVLNYTGTSDTRGEPVTAKVVYKYYTFSAKLINGEPEWSTDVKEAVLDGSQEAVSSGTLYAGQFFSAGIDGYDTYVNNSYTLKGYAPASKIQLVADSGENVINVDLFRNINTLPTTTASIRHIYTHYIKEIVDGKYNERTEVNCSPDSGYTEVATGLYVGNVWSAKPYAAPGAYTMTSTDAELTINLKASGNNVDINYVLTDADVADATLVVKHHYKAYDENGKLIEDPAYTYTVTDDTITSKAGVTVTASENTQQGLFKNDGAASQTVKLAAGENTVTFEYSRHIDTRANASVTVNHVYKTYDKYTNVTTDNTELNHSDVFSTARDASGFITNGIYVGASYTAAPDTPKDTGFAVQTSEADRTIKSLAQTGNVITITYLKTVDSNPGTPVYPPYTPPVVIPDPETPKTDVPETPTPTDPGTDITEPDTPKADAGTQVTGDELVLWIALALASATALVYIIIIDVRRRNGDER